jgi:NAD(P)-dependent dehydrogenase (short-subunit alcohol dehydrogenase family)
MPDILKDKAILITGGSTGIGRATALRCAEEGAALTIADVNVEEGRAIADEINAGGGRACFIESDVTQTDQVKRMIATTVEAYGRLDGAFNNAGIEGAIASIARMSEAEFDRTINIDLKAVWLCVKYQVEQFLKQESPGSIVNTASVAGLVGTRGGSAYGTAKHGVVGLSKCVALEYARKSIRVNAVCPGVIQTPMVDRMVADTGITKQSLLDQQPIGRFGEPREIGEAVVWLLSDLASFVTGVAMPVDGGFSAP